MVTMKERLERLRLKSEAARVGREREDREYEWLRKREGKNVRVYRDKKSGELVAKNAAAPPHPTDVLLEETSLWALWYLPRSDGRGWRTYRILRQGSKMRDIGRNTYHISFNGNRFADGADLAPVRKEPHALFRWAEDVIRQHHSGHFGQHFSAIGNSIASCDDRYEDEEDGD